MERRHHSGRRERESQRRDDRKHRHHESHHHHHHHRVPRDECDRDGKAEKHRSHRERPSNEDMAAPPLRESKDYVHRWLAGTSKEVATKRDLLQPEEPSKKSEERRESKLARQFAHLEKHQKPGYTSDAQRRLKGKYNTWSDSSLLDAQYTKPQVQVEGLGREKRPREQEQSPQPHKRRRVASNNAGSAKGSVYGEHAKETFEKRARHKTREDRYAPKVRDHKADKKEEKKRTTTKRAKNKNNRNPKKDGEELMRDFSSKSIGQDRLTIRPPYSLGLFSNGRTSDAAKDKGIPDLAFSDMDFLHKTEHPRPTIEMEHLKSKTREKEKRKVLKAREDIEDLSAFFKQYRKPLQEVNNNLDRSFSEEIPRTRLESTHPPDQQFLYARQRDRSPTRRPQPPSLVSVARFTDTASKVSGKATTYVTWSETQFSPVKVRPTESYDRRQVSPIPDTVQRSIEKTGIYRDTGIQLRPHPHNSPARKNTTKKGKRYEKRQKSPKDRQRKREYSDRVSDFHSGAGIMSVSSSNQAQSSPQHREIVHHKFRHNGNLEPIIETQSKGFSSRDSSTSETSSSRPTTSTESRANPVIEHCNREMGWHEKERSRNYHQNTSDSLPVSVVPETPLLDRAQIAKNAKVKRPSTTLPILSIAAPGKNLKVGSITADSVCVRPATTEPTTTESTSQIPQSAPYSLHESVNPDKDGKLGPTDQDITDEQHNTPNPQNSGVIHADVKVPAQGPTPQSLAASLHQSRGSSSTIRNSHNGSKLRVNSPALLGGLPLRGGLVHQFDPESRRIDPTPLRPLFIRQAQQSDPVHKQVIPEFARPHTGNMTFLETNSLIPSLIDNHQPIHAGYQNIGPTNVEAQENGVYLEGETYNSMYCGASQEQIFENDLGYAQETFQINQQYNNNQFEDVGDDVTEISMDWYEGSQFQQLDNDGTCYDGRLLTTEALQEEPFQDENGQDNFEIDEGFIQREYYRDEAHNYPEDEWRHHQQY